MDYSTRFAQDVARAIGNRSQRDVAIKMGVSPTTVGNMLSGRIPTDEILVKFAKSVDEKPEAWVRKARMCAEEVHLREIGFLPDEAVKEILAIMSEAEKEAERRESK